MQISLKVMLLVS